MAKPIDLGKKFDDDIGVAISDLKDKTHYPDIYIPHTEDTRLLDMPDTGEATIKYKVVSRSHHEDSRNGKKRRTCCLRLEVLSIEPPEKKGKKTHWEMFNQ